MKAARFYGKEDVRVEDVPETTPGPGQVKIRNEYAGICGSDLHFYFFPEALPFDFSKPNPISGATLPQILGHEFAGTVVEVGEGVTDWKVGDKAAVFPMTNSCGHCAACTNGKPFICRHMTGIGATDEGGGLSEFTTLAAKQLHRLPDNVDLRLGAIVEPMAVGWHGVERSNVKAGDSALLVGAGPIGLGAWFALKAKGVEKILVSESSESRRKVIAELGATVIDPTSEDLAAAIQTMTDGDGVTVAIEAAGAPAALTSALTSLAPGGRAVVLSFHEHPVELPFVPVMMQELEIVGAVGYEPEDFDAVIDAMSRGVYDTTGWVEERSIDDLIDAFYALRGGEVGKILIRID